VTAAGAACSSCGLDRSDDSTLSTPECEPCAACGATAVTYGRPLSETVATSVTITTTFRPGAQERDWQIRWSQLQHRLGSVTAPRSNLRSADTVHSAEQDLFEFFVSAYHLKDALIADGAAPKKLVEAAIHANPNLALLADLANMDKHRRLDMPPRSGEVPVIDGPAAEASDNSATWRLILTIRHKGQRIDALAFANSVIDAWRKSLLALGLPA
jgi:hypothetical protein